MDSCDDNTFISSLTIVSLAKPHYSNIFQVYGIKSSFILMIRPFFLPPTSHIHQFYVVTRSFTRLSMKTKYVCHGLNSLPVNFLNRTK